MDYERLGFDVNPQPTPSSFNDGYSEYETIARLIKLINEFIINNNLIVDEIEKIKTVVDVEKINQMINDALSEINLTSLIDDVSQQNNKVWSGQKVSIMINEIYDLLGNVELETLDKTIKGAINEIKNITTTIKNNIGNGELTTTDKTLKGGLNEINLKVDNINNILGSDNLTTDDETLKGAINEINAKIGLSAGGVSDEVKAYIQNLFNGGVNKSSNATYPLFIPTYDGSNQITHPSLIYFPDKFGGFHYWLAATPYPNMNDFYENPCVFASNDLLNWTSKIVLSSVTSGSNTHYSDTCIFHRADLNRLEVWYRWRDKISGNEQLYRNYSTDGTSWGSRELVYNFSFGDTTTLSPAVLFEDGKYKMWYVNQNRQIRYCESYVPENWQHLWENNKIINIPFADEYSSSNYKVWHIDVKHTEIGYELLINAYKSSEENQNKNELFYTKTTDNITFEKAKKILQPTTGTTRFDNKMIYKSTLIKVNGMYYVIYGAMNTNNEFQCGLIYGDTITNLKYYSDWKIEIPLIANGESSLSLTSGQNNKIILRSDGLIFIQFTVSSTAGIDEINNGDVLFYVPPYLRPNGNVVFSGAIQKNGATVFSGAWLTITTAGEMKCYTDVSPVRYVSGSLSYYR